MCPQLVGILLFATAPYHNLGITGLTIAVRPTTTVVTYTLEPLSLLISGYTLLLVLIGTVLVAWTALTDPELYADQTIGLLVGALMPIAGAVITLSGVFAVGNINLTPLTLGVTAVGYGYALFRTDLLSTNPSVAIHGEDIAIEQLSEGFLVIDGRGVVVEANTAAQELLNRSQLSNQSVTAVLGGNISDASGQQLLRLDDGTVLEAQCMPINLTRDGETGQVITLRDVTARERRQERLQVLNRVLRHNVRNNLQIVRGYARRIADGETSHPDPADAATLITEQVDDLLSAATKARMVNQRLNAEQNPAQTTVDLPALLAACVEQKQTETAAAVDIQTEFPDTCDIESDPDVLRLVVNEALDNAIQHTEADATTRVEVSKQDDICIRISDTGPGIPEQERRVVLRGTESAVDHTKHFGLWMIRWGARYLGGDLSIRDRSPTGTVVEVTLPQ